MALDLIKELIADFQQSRPFLGLKRHLRYETVRGKAFVCVGVRRAGKSTFLHQIADDLEKKGVDRSDMLYVNFFDDRLRGLQNGGLSLLLDAYYALYPEKKGVRRLACFFDEIQEVRGWEPFVDRILRAEKCDVFLTGSSAKMLSTEVATQMRGRSLSWELFPFSFREALDYEGADPASKTSRGRYLLEKVFRAYLTRGGFPEVWKLPAAVRVRVHQEYMNAIFHRDVIERHDVSHPQAVVHLGHKLLHDTGSLVSVNRLFEFLKNAGFRVTKEFLSSCLGWFEDARFLFLVRMYSPSVNKQHVNPKKVYCVDHGLVPSVVPAFSANTGHMLENMVFSHLRRKTDRIFYHRTRAGREVDFLWMDESGRRHLIQVAASLAEERTRARELAALREACDELALREATVVTLGETETLTEDKRTFHVVPAGPFLAGL